jgi:hypothetical protein
VGTSGRQMVQGQGDKGVYGGCILYPYMKMEEWNCWNCSKKGGRWEERKMEGVNSTKIYFKHICKYHNIALVQILYANKIILKMKKFKRLS